MFAVCVCVASYNSSSMIQTFKTFGYLPINNQTVAKMAPQYTITYYNIGYEFYGVVSDATKLTSDFRPWPSQGHVLVLMICSFLPFENGFI